MWSGTFARRLAATLGAAAFLVMAVIGTAAGCSNEGTDRPQQSPTSAPQKSGTVEESGTEKSIISSITSWLSSVSRSFNPPGPSGPTGVRG